jgi:hypothetical protein
MTGEPEDDPTTGEQVPSAPIFTVDPSLQPQLDTTVDPSLLAPAIIDPLLQPLIDHAVQDLTGQLPLAALSTNVEVLEARSVVWPDAGLGCPAPGMVYIQVPVDGTLIRLRVGNQVYEYHSGGRRAPFLCSQPQKEIPISPPGFGAGV